MEFLHELYNMLRHLSPDSVNQFAAYCGVWLYLVLFMIVFCETGFVVTPFLPGDSLLFALGAVAASGDAVSLPAAGVLLCIAAIGGDMVNYTLGYKLGPKVFSRESSRLLNKRHLYEAQRFYEKHGAFTIVIARFVPIVRTFAPFVAGIGKMHYRRFMSYNIFGGIMWVWSFLLFGYLVGRNKWVQSHFHFIILLIVVISVIPAVIHFLKARKGSKLAGACPECGEPNSVDSAACARCGKSLVSAA